MISAQSIAAAQPFIDAQHAISRRIAGHFGVRVIPTDDTSYAEVDAVIEKDGMIAAVAEIKSRRMSLEALTHMGSALITEHKLNSMCQAARLLCAEGFLFYHLREGDALMYWRLCDDRGQLCLDVERRRMQTPRTVEGGVANRVNVFVPVSGGILI